MSTALLDLEDRIITDAGSMVAKHDLLVKLALSAEPFSHLPFVSYQDSDRYHKGNPKALRWVSKEPQNPPASTYEWMLPEEYADRDIEEYCMERMADLHLDQKPEYMDRLCEELIRVEEKQMHDFIRCLIWITDVLRVKKIVWGLGRGSSCASLVMFILGVNKVDPVLYDIPMEEFYK